MIKAGLEFPHSARRLVLETFLSLPRQLCPSHQSESEDEVAKGIKDRHEFFQSALKRETGFFLRGPHLTCDISFADPQPISCSGFLDTNPVFAKEFMGHMASAQPIFGFACAPEEREWRNRITTRQGVNSIESWVGRDTQKYVPGLYWLTLLPAALAEKHAIPLSAIDNIVLEHSELESSQHLFQLYERPEAWHSATAVAELTSSLPGIFHIETARAQLAAAKNFLDLDKMVRDWK